MNIKESARKSQAVIEKRGVKVIDIEIKIRSYFNILSAVYFPTDFVENKLLFIIYFIITNVILILSNIFVAEFKILLLFDFFYNCT